MGYGSRDDGRRSLLCNIGDETGLLELSPPNWEIGVSLDLRFRASLRCEGCLCWCEVDDGNEELEELGQDSSWN